MNTRKFAENLKKRRNSFILIGLGIASLVGVTDTGFSQEVETTTSDATTTCWVAPQDVGLVWFNVPYEIMAGELRHRKCPSSIVVDLHWKYDENSTRAFVWDLDSQALHISSRNFSGGLNCRYTNIQAFSVGHVGSTEPTEVERNALNCNLRSPHQIRSSGDLLE